MCFQQGCRPAPVVTQLTKIKLREEKLKELQNYVASEVYQKFFNSRPWWCVSRIPADVNYFYLPEFIQVNEKKYMDGGVARAIFF